MTGLFKQLKDHGVDILTYRMIGIERIESFNSKRKPRIQLRSATLAYAA